MSADLTCPTCKGEWEATTPRGFPCPYCDDGRRRPELHEWDALEAERDQAKEAVRNLDKALRNAVKERGDALDERDRLREALKPLAHSSALILRAGAVPALMPGTLHERLDERSDVRWLPVQRPPWWRRLRARLCGGRP